MDPGGHILGSRAPKDQSDPLPPPQMVNRCDFFYSFGLFFFTDMSVATKHWRFMMAIIFYRFLRYKISQFSSEFQNIPEIGCLRIHNRFIPNFNLLKTHIFFYIANINFGQVFDDLGGPPLPVANRTFFFKSEFWLRPKTSGLNPRNFQFWGYSGLVK